MGKAEAGDLGGILSQVSTVIKQNNKKQLGKGRVYFVLQFSGHTLSPREERAWIHSRKCVSPASDRKEQQVSSWRTLPQPGPEESSGTFAQPTYCLSASTDAS